MATSALFPSVTHWRSLRYFSIYRLIIGVLLIFSVRIQNWGGDPVAIADSIGHFEKAAWIYVGGCLLSLLAVARWPVRFNTQLTIQVAFDAVVFIVLLHSAGGIRSGIGILLLVSLAGAGLVGQGRLVLSYAAFATLLLLSQQVYQALSSEFEGPLFIQAGAMSMAFFAIAILARLLARRLLASEDLARQRGEDLQRQLKLTTRVIAMLDDGVLVVSSSGGLIQANPRARGLLGLATGGDALGDVHSGLADAFRAWRSTALPAQFEFRAGPQRALLTARFLDVPDAGGDALVFLQDVGEQRGIAQRQKLAALGRLTGGVAHEIRNPLSAIRYAAELLQEDNRNVTDRRMLDIVLDNTQRLERIVRDVLELGRRDRANPQAIALQVFLPAFVAEFVATSGWPAGRIALGDIDSGEIQFDPSHLRQVLWNLVGNAGRYATGRDGGIRLSAGGLPRHIAVDDDGPGISPEATAQLFEPFFTTDPQGNGLGLYIARELCEANGCRLHYEKSAAGGARFIITGGA